MTTDDPTPQDRVAAIHELIARIERSRDEQPVRLAEMREQAEAERKRALADEPWDEMWGALPGYNRDGEVIGMMALPSINGKELFGTRLAFDLLGCCDDEDQVIQTLGKYYAMIKDPSHTFLVAFAALDTIVNHIIPEMLRIIEDQAGNWDVRVTLADAARNAWAARVNDIRHADDGTTED